MACLTATRSDRHTLGAGIRITLVSRETGRSHRTYLPAHQGWREWSAVALTLITVISAPARHALPPLHGVGDGTTAMHDARNPLPTASLSHKNGHEAEWLLRPRARHTAISATPASRSRHEQCRSRSRRCGRCRGPRRAEVWMMQPGRLGRTVGAIVSRGTEENRQWPHHQDTNHRTHRPGLWRCRYPAYWWVPASRGGVERTGHVPPPTPQTIVILSVTPCAGSIRRESSKEADAPRYSALLGSVLLKTPGTSKLMAYGRSRHRRVTEDSMRAGGAST